ncbi:SIR2 family protein [Burkholderia cenocepacia]|uniref:SIR2 family protein n=1 Tax=Burkholderia cepacia complex TaxID=87882 RepID=UPI001B9F55B3|nr:SIR2 family protein [Burkholderia orbicola]MBR8036898.1 SIR2 family protein [Burkholderia cenocepacia]MDN7578370.1 SIR2 family protein [Burkholderia orbicola]MDN7579217.1 SIR2 family protein [Burkholderia orbicola]
MEYQRALASAVGGKAILFVGAGFSRGATAVSRDTLPSGRELAKILCIDAGVPLTEDLKLATSRYLKKKNSDDLVDRLRDLFTIQSVTEEHRSLAAIPWRSIYTTNYDNVLERAAAERSKRLTPLTLNKDPRAYKRTENTVLHINGYVDELTVDALNNSFKLTNASYLTQQFRESIWSDVFIRDMQAAQAIFFVGYSLYDIDIQELIFSDDRLRDKTFFIQRDGMNQQELDDSDLNDFGTIVPIGLGKFASDLASVDPSAVGVSGDLILTSFDEMKVVGANAAALRDEDVTSLLLRGQVKEDLVIDRVLSNSRVDYALSREIEGEMAGALSKSENIVIHGDLANGKSMLLRILGAHLLSRGYRVFWLHDEAYDCLEEIEQIIGVEGPVALVFDNYPRKLKLITHANIKRKADTRILLSARTMDHEASEEDLYFSRAMINLQRTAEFNINKLTPLDLDSLASFFERYGLWGEKAKLKHDAKIRYLQKDCNSELHGALLGLLDSPQIREKFNPLFNEVRNSKAFAKSIIAAFSLNMINVNSPTFHMIAAMTGDSSIFNPAFKNSESAKQLFNSQRGIITPKSSVLAEYALKHFPDVSMLVNSLVEICVCTRKKAEASELYWDIYRALASFKHIQKMLPDVGKRDALISFYEGLRSIDIERKNPHFWLQYAIARLSYADAKDLELAKQCLDTALSLADARPNYTITDIQTQYARYHLEYAINVASDANSAFSEFKKGHELLLGITAKEKYKREPFRPARLYEQIYKKFQKYLVEDQKIFLLGACDNILENIRKLPPRTAEDKAVVATRENLEAMRKAIHVAINA